MPTVRALCFRILIPPTPCYAENRIIVEGIYENGFFPVYSDQLHHLDPGDAWYSTVDEIVPFVRVLKTVIRQTMALEPQLLEMQQMHLGKCRSASSGR
jgi:hypothetical protein